MSAREADCPKERERKLRAKIAEMEAQLTTAEAERDEARAAAEAVAVELDTIAEREEKALQALSLIGYEASDDQLNYPSEQRALAARLRQPAEFADPDPVTCGEIENGELRNRLELSEDRNAKADALAKAVGVVGSRPCERSTTDEGCAGVEGWTIGAEYADDGWCDPCTVRAALEDWSSE